LCANLQHFTLCGKAAAADEVPSFQVWTPQDDDISHQMEMQANIPGRVPTRCRQNGKDGCRYRLQ